MISWWGWPPEPDLWSRWLGWLSVLGVIVGVVGWVVWLVARAQYQDDEDYPTR